MRAYLPLALLSLACSSTVSTVSGDGDHAAGAAGLSDTGSAGETQENQGGGAGEPGGASGAASGGTEAVGVGGRTAAAGGNSGEAGSAGEAFVAGTASDPYYLGDGKRCPQIALDALMTWDKLNPGVPRYYDNGACHGWWEPAPFVGGVIRADVDFGSDKIAVKPDTCAQVTVIPEDGSETQCTVTGWYSSVVKIQQDLTFGGKLTTLSVGYWVVVQYFARTVRDRNSICPDECGYL